MDMLDTIIENGRNIFERKFDTFFRAEYVIREKRLDKLGVILKCNPWLAKYRDRGTLLDTAVLEGHFECVKMLLDAGADPNQRTTKPAPLAAAISYRDIETAKLLIQYGADVNKAEYSKDFNGDTPAMLAAKHGDISVFIALAENGADLEKNGETIIKIAKENRQTDIANYIIASHDQKALDVLIDADEDNQINMVF